MGKTKKGIIRSVMNLESGEGGGIRNGGWKHRSVKTSKNSENQMARTFNC